MSRRFYLTLSMVILIGIQPVFAQEDESAGEAITGEEAVLAENTTDMELASESEFTGETITDEKTVLAENTTDMELASDSEFTGEATTGKKTVFAEKTIDMELASDSEFTEALKASSDIELINKNDIQPAGKKPSAQKPVLAEGASINTEPAPAKETAANTEDDEISGSIRNNEYLLESQRLARLAEEAYNYGDYDASAGFAEEAIRYAELSDEYAARQAGSAAGAPAADGTFPLPASYTIRAWNVSHDCFWNIAGRPWVYGDPHKWRILYNANKAKLPDPNNPNLIEPGIVLDIPSLKGEVRQGAWDGNKTYKPLQ